MIRGHTLTASLQAVFGNVSRPSPESGQSQAEMRLCCLVPIESPPIVMPRLEIAAVVAFFEALLLFGEPRLA